MKLTNLLITVTSIFLVSNSFAGDSDGVKKLRDEYHKKMMKAAAPINKEYEANLQYGLKKALKFNHDDDAKAISEELAALKEDPAYLLNVVDSSIGVAQFAGKWKLDINSWLYIELSVSEDGHADGYKSGFANGEKWDFGKLINHDIIYDSDTELYILQWLDMTISFKMSNKDRIKLKYWDQHSYPNEYRWEGKAKRIKD